MLESQVEKQRNVPLNALLIDVQERQKLYLRSLRLSEIQPVPASTLNLWYHQSF